MIILNSGGTFNKVYDPIIGDLVVPKNNDAVEEILKKVNLSIPVYGLIYKDSLEFTQKDREKLLEAVKGKRSVVIVHGTDTMEESATFLAKNLPKESCVVFTGSMYPYSIDPVQASANLMLAISKALYFWSEGVFIAMNGIVDSYERVKKDRKRGIFVKS
ncbi:MAG: asparaginase [Epsilonproteobacteria bacterium]|nr:asparaginase [Campylobacterota bacterium]